MAVNLMMTVFPIDQVKKEELVPNFNEKFDDFFGKIDEISAFVQGSRLSKTDCMKLVQEKFNLKKRQVEIFFRSCV